MNDDGHRVDHRHTGRRGVEEAHDDTASIAGGGATPDVEAHLEVLGQNVLVERRQHGIAILAVHRRGAVEIHIKVSAGDIGVDGGGAIGVIDAPALVELHAAAGGAGGEVLAPRQGVDGGAGGAGGEGARPRGVAAADSHQIEVVEGIRSQTGDNAEGVGEVGPQGVFVAQGEARGAIADSPGSSSVVDPAEADRTAVGALEHEGLRRCAAGKINTSNIDLETVTLDRTIRMESDGYRSGGKYGAEALKFINTIVGPKFLARSANAGIDAEVVVGALGVGGASDVEGMQVVGRINNQRGIAAARIGTSGAAVVINDGSTGVEGVGARGGHVHDEHAHAEVHRASPYAVVSRAAVGTDVSVIHAVRQLREVEIGGGGRKRLGIGSVVGIKTGSTVDELPGSSAVVGPSEGKDAVALGRSKSGGSIADRASGIVGEGGLGQE